MKHIEFAKLIEKHEGSLSRGEVSEISKHLAICEDCNLSNRKLGDFFEFSENSSSYIVPQKITANLLNIYKPKKAAIKNDKLINRIFGELIFDDWQFALNERFTYSDSRQLLYKGRDFEVDLRLQFINGKCMVSGQVFPDVESNAKIKIISENEKFETNLNENCEFSFSPITEGIYDLQINFENTVIEISKISLLI